MPTLTDSPHNVIEALRGDRARRPPCDLSSAPGLRAMLDDGIFALLASLPNASRAPIIVRNSAVRNVQQSTDIGNSNRARLRGVLINQLVRLLSVGAPVTNAFDDALRAWHLDVDRGELFEYAQRLEGDELAQLSSDVTSHFVTLSRALGTIPAPFLPRSAVRASVLLHGGAVVVRDVVDLMVGSTYSEVASVALFDVTTSPLGEGAERSMRYHALVHTLRTGVVPLRTSVFSSATGQLWTLDVDTELLVRGVNDVLDTIRGLLVHA